MPNCEEVRGTEIELLLAVRMSVVPRYNGWVVVGWLVDCR